MTKKAKKEVKRYSETRKATLLEKYHELRKNLTALSAAQKLRVPYITLRYWERNGSTQPVLARGTKPAKRKAGRPKGSKNRVVKTAKPRTDQAYQELLQQCKDLQAKLQKIAKLVG